MKTGRFLLPQCLPISLPRSCGGPALAPALVLQVVGWGPWHHCQVLQGRCWTWSSQPPGTFMSILAREGQEASRQVTSFRHAFLKGIKKGNVDMVKWASENIPAKGEKKSPKQVCPQTSPALALFLPFSALLSSVTGSSTVGISFL